MANQKLENLLNLALDATPEEREKSLELEVGYYPIDQEWDLIMKYSGDLYAVREIAVQVTELLNEFAIVTVKESMIGRLSSLPQVEYIEKPKRLFFQVVNGRRVSCVNEVQDTRFSLFGQGTLIAVIDSGIDYENFDFRNADGTTRIRVLWDQAAGAVNTQGITEGESPEGYRIGSVYTDTQINEALTAGTSGERRRIVPSMDTSGHGTAVAGIAAGNGRESGGLYAGVAPQSELIVVKLGSPRRDGFPRTTELMMGIDFAVRKAIEYQKPLAVNLSFGNTYGAHVPYS